MSASVLKSRQVKHIENRAFFGLISNCNFFATPTRLAAGLGTKDYPRVYCETPRPGLAFLQLNNGSPVPILENIGFGDQLFNNSYFSTKDRLISRCISL
jgi:hypothetical protein